MQLAAPWVLKKHDLPELVDTGKVPAGLATGRKLVSKGGPKCYAAREESEGKPNSWDALGLNTTGIGAPAPAGVVPRRGTRGLGDHPFMQHTERVPSHLHV